MKGQDMKLLKKLLGPKKVYTKYNNLNWVRLTTKKIRSETFLHPHCEEEKANLFFGFDAGGTEIETLYLLWAYIRLFKPKYVLETGTFTANGTTALAAAFKEYGFGKLITLEMSEDNVKQALKKLKRRNLSDYVDVVLCSSLDYAKQVDTKKIKFDIAFFDSDTSIRATEFQMLYDRGALTDLVSFHDTSRLRTKSFNDEHSSLYISRLDEIEKKYCKGGIEFSLSRGFRMMQLRKDINPAFK